ncbi:hypothetical protein DL96DRAFT_1767165 [Flagelloscypha sp. PMI_526]|nr:hypothetical protein DL96DRAFT_1767165 [Flagelloscypha sp. PMI_526]
MNSDVPDSAYDFILSQRIFSDYRRYMSVGHRGWSWVTIYLATTTLVMFIVTNIHFFVFLRLQTSIVEVMLRTNNGRFTNRARLELAQDGIKGSRVIQALPRLINFALGDGVVVHRAFVIAGVQVLDHPRRVLFTRTIMILFLLASIGMFFSKRLFLISLINNRLQPGSSFYDGYLSILLGTQSLQFALTGRSNVVPDITAITLSFSTNFIATITIAITARHQLLPAFVIVSPHKTSNAASRAFRQVVHLLILLTETAVLYCVLQFVAILCLAVPVKLGNEPDIATAAYLSSINYLSALYPTVLIIIFSRQSKGENSLGVGSSNPEGQHELKESTEAALAETLTFPSQVGGQRTTNVSGGLDEWQKARGSYTNFVA